MPRLADDAFRFVGNDLDCQGADDDVLLPVEQHWITGFIDGAEQAMKTLKQVNGVPIGELTNERLRSLTTTANRGRRTPREHGIHNVLTRVN